MKIRDARPADAEGLAALLAELGYPDAPERVAVRVAAFVADPASRLFVAEDGSGPVGLAPLTVLPLLHEDGAWCRVSALVVAQASRGEGVGLALLEEAEAFARHQGCRSVEVTSGEGPEREAAHCFYQALGYEQVSRRYLKPLA
jgi:GNAT superfamily N-acetyltransferase